MNDVGTIIRKAYYDALNNNILVPGSPSVYVPIVDEKLDSQITDADLYMLVGAQTETPYANKTIFMTTVELTIRIVNRRKATNSKTLVEQVADNMLSILFPSKGHNGLTVSAPFKLISAVMSSPATYDFQKLEDGWQISKVLSFKNLITQ